MTTKLVRNIIIGLFVLATCIFLFLFWTGAVGKFTRCEALWDLEVNELITAEERMAWQVFYFCDDTPDLKQIPLRQLMEVMDIYVEIKSQRPDQ